MSTHCINCGGILEERFTYCPFCSQKVKLHRLSLHDVTHEGIHYFTHADKSIFKLLQQLVSRTGAVAKDYVRGQRKKYFPPLNFFLLVATLLVLVFSIVSPSSKPANLNHREVNSIEGTTSRERVNAIGNRQNNAIRFMNKYSNIVAMIAVPLICVFYRLFYIRGPYNYTEHLVACMYMVGFTNLLYALLFVPLSIFSGLTQGPSWVPIFIFMVFQIIYNSVFYYKFIGREGMAAGARAATASLFAVLFWYIFSALLVGVYIKNGFGGLLA